MIKKLVSVAAFGAGYVLGARAGRERYDQIMGSFHRVRTDPRVQEQAHSVAETFKEQAPIVRDKVSEAASSAVAKVRPSSSESPDPDMAPDFIEETPGDPDQPTPAI